MDVSGLPSHRRPGLEDRTVLDCEELTTREVDEVLAGSDASMAPGLETREALESRRAAADYWTKV